MASGNIGLARSLVAGPRELSSLRRRSSLAAVCCCSRSAGRWRRLEGVGVVPTIEVRADPASVGLSDPQLDRAIAVLSGA